MEIKYRAAAPCDCEKALELTNRYVNAQDDFVAHMRWLHEHLGDSSLGVMAFDEELAVGAVYAVKGMELTGGREDFFEDIKKDIGDELIWSGSIIVVDKTYRMCGIASKLLQALLSNLSEHGIKHLLIEIWVRPDGSAPSDSTRYVANSFTDYGLIENFYANIPALKDHVCQVCGPKCKCGARISVLHI